MDQKAPVSAHSHLRHWHHVYQKRRAPRINAKQMSYAQVIALLGSIIAGVLLDANKTSLVAFAGAFVILPGVFDVGGSLGASLSAKINHRLDSSAASSRRIFISSTLFTLLIAVCAGLVVSLLGATVATIFFDAIWWEVLVVAELSIIVCGLIGFPIVGILSIVLRRYNINPDDVAGPIEASLFDILAVAALGVIAGLFV